MDPNAPTPEPGATPPTGTPAEPAKTEPPKTEPTDTLGDAGKKALAEERAARKALEQQMKALEPLKALADALGVKPEQGKTDVETLTKTVAEMQSELAAERLGRLRLEIAAEKGLTPAQAARLTGSTREDLAKDADALKELFPTSTTPGTPRPDPTQGARGGAGELEALMKAAKDKGDTRELIRLKQIKAEQNRK